MTPIAISNQRPGFVPFSTRPLVIATSRQAFKPSSYHSKLDLSQAPPPAPPAFPPNMTEEEIVRLAAKLMIDSGNKVAANLRSVNTTYAGQGSAWLAEAAASFFAFGPAGPIGVALDTWWQSSRANQALAKISAARAIGQSWINSMSDTWLPAFIDRIYKVDQALGDQIDATFRQVTSEMAKSTKLVKGVSELPPVIVTSMVSTFFGSLKSDLDSTAKTLYDLLKALSDLVRGGASIISAAPMAVVIVGLGALIYFTTKS